MATRMRTRSMAMNQGLDINEDQSLREPNPRPRKRARTETSIPTKQKLKLTKLDAGRCLVTGESESFCIDTCHILRRKTVETEVGGYESPSLFPNNDSLLQLSKYERSWALIPRTFNVDSTRNLIHCTLCSALVYMPTTIY